MALGDYMNVQCHACIGGTNVGEDIRKLDYGQHVVSGTPGRVFGMFWFNNLNFILKYSVKRFSLLDIIFLPECILSFQIYFCDRNIETVGLN